MQGREDTMRAISDQGLAGEDLVALQYREKYGNQAFDQYLQAESNRDEQSQLNEDAPYGEQDEPLAIEYPHKA